MTCGQYSVHPKWLDRPEMGLRCIYIYIKKKKKNDKNLYYIPTVTKKKCRGKSNKTIKKKYFYNKLLTNWIEQKKVPKRTKNIRTICQRLLLMTNYKSDWQPSNCIKMSLNLSTYLEWKDDNSI